MVILTAAVKAVLKLPTQRAPSIAPLFRSFQPLAGLQMVDEEQASSLALGCSAASDLKLLAHLQGPSGLPLLLEALGSM